MFVLNERNALTFAPFSIIPNKVMQIVIVRWFFFVLRRKRKTQKSRCHFAIKRDGFSPPFHSSANQLIMNGICSICDMKIYAVQSENYSTSNRLRLYLLSCHSFHQNVYNSSISTLLYLSSPQINLSLLFALSYFLAFRSLYGFVLERTHVMSSRYLYKRKNLRRRNNIGITDSVLRYQRKTVDLNDEGVGSIQGRT